MGDKTVAAMAAADDADDADDDWVGMGTEAGAAAEEREDG